MVALEPNVASEVRRLGLSDQRQASGKTESSRRGDTEREQDRRWRMRQPIKQEGRRFEIEVPEIVVSRASSKGS